MKYIYGDNYCRFERLPFYWHPLDNYKDNVFSRLLPFELFYDKETGILRQRPIKEVIEALKLAYRQGSEIIGLMDSNGIGYNYAQDFITFIDKTIGLNNIANKKILEIGCGTGYLLHKMKLLGGEVIGYEPGFSKIGKYPVSVVKKFFPSKEIKNRKFDIIITYSLLEHVVDIEKMLSAIHKNLKDSGALLISVPDCQEYIHNGDISMLLHEHFSYFTKETLQSFLEKIGFVTHAIKKSYFGNCLYGSFKKGDILEVKHHENNIFLEKVFEKMDQNIQKMGNFIKQHKNKVLGIYVPIRALNILSLYRDLIKNLNIP